MRLSPVYYIDATKSKLFGYLLPTSLNLINYKNIGFIEGRVVLHGEVRTNQESALIQYTGMGEEEATSIGVSTETAGMDIQGQWAQRLIGDFIVGKSTGRQKFAVTIDDGGGMPIDDVDFGVPLPIREKHVTSVAEIITNHKKGKMQTEGMQNFLQGKISSGSRYSLFGTVLPFLGVGLLCGGVLWFVLKNQKILAKNPLYVHKADPFHSLSLQKINIHGGANV